MYLDPFEIFILSKAIISGNLKMMNTDEMRGISSNSLKSIICSLDLLEVQVVFCDLFFLRCTRNLLSFFSCKGNTNLSKLRLGCVSGTS